MNEKLLKNNYLIIPNFITFHKASLLAREFSNYCKNNNIGGDEQCQNSHSCYNYISFLELLCEKTPEVSSILEETVLPTYCYARVYKKNSILEKHKDRDACEISLTVHLGGDKVWPICIETPEGEHRSVCLNPGDAMLYLGCTAEHWREQYDGEEYSQLFLHYVRSRGDKSYSYFDLKNNKDSNQNSDIIKSNNLENNCNLEAIQSEIITSSASNEPEETNKESALVFPTAFLPKPTTTLEDFIHVFDNVMSDSICDALISEYQNSHEWRYAEIVDGLDTSYRNCKEICISSESVISKNYDIRKNIDDMSFSSISTALEKYRQMHPTFNIEIDTGYQILRYEENQFYKEHTDSFKQQQRAVSCSIQLNDDYEGGEFAFFGREMMIRAGKGSAIVFPSNFMYPHEIMPVLKGTRYSLITWFV